MITQYGMCAAALATSTNLYNFLFDVVPVDLLNLCILHCTELRNIVDCLFLINLECILYFLIQLKELDKFFAS